MNRRRVAPAILIFSCLALGAVSFLRLQANAPRNFGPLPDKIYPLDQPANRELRAMAIQVVTAQLNAFRQNNIGSAETDESEITRGGFESADQFREYATGDSPELEYYDRVAYSDVITDAMKERVLVSARVTGADKVTVNVSFMLIHDSDGVYRILGMRGGRRGLGMGFADPP